MTQAFLPMSSLAHIFPISNQRAVDCADILKRISQGGTQKINMSEVRKSGEKAEKKWKKTQKKMEKNAERNGKKLGKIVAVLLERDAAAAAPRALWREQRRV